MYCELFYHSHLKSQELGQIKRLNYNRYMPLFKTLKGATLNHVTVMGETRWIMHTVHMTRWEYITHYGMTVEQEQAVSEIDCVIELLPKDSSAPISSLRIALHHQEQVSLMIFCKAGVVNRVLDALTVLADEPSIDLQSQVIFAQRVGHDTRARMTFWANRNPKGVESFLANVHQLCGFDEPVMQLCQSILAQYLMICQNPEHTSWSIVDIPKSNKLTDNINGIPNRLPDPVDIRSEYSYPDILSFPKTLPAIHLLVLKGDLEALKNHLTDSSEEVLYQRDPFGLLAIDLAERVDPVIAEYLFLYWYNLPHAPAQKPLYNKYMQCADMIGDSFYQMPMGYLYEDRQYAALAYVQQMLPDMPNATEVYEWAINDNQEAYSKWYQSWREDIEIWASLLKRHDVEQLKQKTLQKLPQPFDLWVFVLRNDKVACQRYLSLEYNKIGRYPVLNYLMALRNSIDVNASFEDVKQKILDEIKYWFDVYHAIKNNQFQTADTLLKRNIKGVSVGQLLSLPYKSSFSRTFSLEEIFASNKIPLQIIWLHECGLTEQPSIHQWVNEQRKVLSLYPNFETVVNCILKRTPRRGILHEAVLNNTTMTSWDLIAQLKAFKNLYDSLIKVQHQVWQTEMSYIEHLDSYIKNRVLKRTSTISYTFSEELKNITREISVYEKSHDALKQELCKLYEKWQAFNTEYEIAQFKRHASRLLKIKHTGIQAIKAQIIEYRAQCTHLSNEEFDIYTAVLAILAGKVAIESNTHQEISIYSKIVDVYVHFINKLDCIEKRKHCFLKYDANKEPHVLMEHVRRHLVFAEYQDPWGYTPLFLAVASNHKENVKSYFEAGLFSDVIVNPYTDVRGGMKYSLLDYAKTPDMVSLLLYYFCNPNQPSSVMSRMQWDYQEPLLRYGYTIDNNSAAMSEISAIISGTSRYDRQAQRLASFLKYYEHLLVDAPYDDCVAPDVREIIARHNARIRLQQSMVKQSPKISEQSYENGALLTLFKKPQQHDTAFKSRLYRVCELDEAQKRALAEIFALNFKMREGVDEHSKRKEFFMYYLEKHPDFYIDIYYDCKDREVGFFTFILKQNAAKQGETEQYDVMYLSIVACLPAANQGLPLSTLRAVLAAQTWSESQYKKLYVYARIARPGIAIKLLAKGPWSVMYAVDKGRVHYVAEELIGDRLEPDGQSSLAPVLSLAIRRNEPDWLLETFVFWLNNNPYVHPDASLIIMSEVTPNMRQEWMSRMHQQHGLTDADLTFYQSAFEDFCFGQCPSLVHNSNV